MTGNLAIWNNSVDRDGAAPSADSGRGFFLDDKDGENMSAVQSIIRTDGRSDVGLYAFNEPNGGSSDPYINAFRVQMDKEGAASYYVTAPAAFRTAIGAASLTGVNVITGAFDRKFTNWDSKATSGWVADSANLIGMRDKNDIYVGQLRFNAQADGSVETALVARRGLSTDSGGIKQNFISAKVTASGEFQYFVASPYWFRRAIGLEYYGRISGLSANKTLTTTAAKMPLKTFYGSGCTSSSNGIKFNTTGTFLIWGSAYISTGTTQNNIIHVQLRVNDVTIYDQLTRTSGASPYEVYTVGPWIYPCTDANHVLSLYVYNQAEASGVVTDANTTNVMAVKIA